MKTEMMERKRKSENAHLFTVFINWEETC